MRANAISGKQMNRRCGACDGFSMMELICVIAIIGILVALLLPAVQQVRESARSITCLNNLRNIGLASLSYESAFRALPAGTLGFPITLRVPEMLTEDDWTDNPQHQYYSLNVQHVASFVVLLPYLEHEGIYDLFPTNAIGLGSVIPWPGDHPVVRDAAGQSLPVFMCPTDDLARDQRSPRCIATQPGYRFNRVRFQFDGFLSAYANPSQHPLPGLTNYAGCSGAHAGGKFPVADYQGYEGVMLNRERTALRSILDGTSHTIMYAETLGTVENYERRVVRSWAFGGLAKGRGRADWGQVLAPDGKTFFIGDRKYAWFGGFASAHPSTIKAVRSDGSVTSLVRSIDLGTWYALCGRADGSAIAGD